MSEKKQLTGKRVFLYFAIFFAIIFTVDYIILKLAIRSNPGVEVEHTYEKEMRLQKNQNDRKE